MTDLYYLSDIEQEHIIRMNNTPALINAVRKVLLESVYNNGVLRKGSDPTPTRNAALGLAIIAVNGQAIVNNEQLGEDLRAIAQAVAFIEQGFKKLSEIKEIQQSPETEEENPGK